MKALTKKRKTKKSRFWNKTKLEQEEVFPESSTQLYKDYTKNKESQRAVNRYEDKPYQEAHRTKRLLASLAGIVMQIMGGILALFAINRLLFFLFPKFPYVEILTVLIATLLLVLLEFAKRLLWDEFFSERYRTGKIPVAILLISVVLFSISAASSTVGSYQLTMIMMDSTTKIQEESNVNIAGVENSYNQQIQEYRHKINQIEKEVKVKIKKGIFLTTPPSEEKKLAFYTSQIEKLQKERDRKTGKIETVTASETQDIKATAEKYAMAGLGLSALFEVFAVICIAYLAFFDFRVYLETRASQKAQGEDSEQVESISFEEGNFSQNELVRLFLQVNQLPQQLKTAMLSPAPVVNQASTYSNSNTNDSIGFQMIKNKPELNFKNTKKEKTRKNRRTYTITCKNCGTVAEKKSPNARYCSDTCRKEYNKKKKK